MADTLFPLSEKRSKESVQGTGKPRLETANRHQVEMRLAALDDLLPEDHRARLVWKMVESYDLSSFYQRIAAVEGEPGRPAIDPRLLLAVWLYGTLEGVTSARQLDRLCKDHLAYQWLLGGVTVNYHTLADFRVGYEAELDELLTQNVAALIQTGEVSLERTAQDGMRVRASAGASSFRRQPTLEQSLRQAEALVEQQKRALQSDESGEGSGPSARQRAAQERHARERVERVKRALEEVAKVAEQRAKNRESKREKKPARASTTDPEARVMKMPDGGFRPAFNGQLAIDIESRIIIGVEVSNEADQRLLGPMIDQTAERYGQLMQEHYVDGGFRSKAGIEELAEKQVEVYSPIPAKTNRKSKYEPHEILRTDGPGVRAWKQRMVTEEAKEKYKDRAATVEWANALARIRRLYQFIVRGMRKARAVLLWYALAHNLIQTVKLQRRLAAQAG
jgi:transposase